jgi:hypothetical protein
VIDSLQAENERLRDRINLLETDLRQAYWKLSETSGHDAQL